MSTNKQKENTLLKLIDVNNKYFPILTSISLSYIFCEFIERIEKNKIDNTCIEYDKYMPICFLVDIKNKVSYDLAVSKDELIKAATSKKLIKPNIIVTKDETTFKRVIGDKLYKSIILSVLNIIDDIDDDSSIFSDFIEFGSPDYAFTDVLNDMKQFIKIGSIYNTFEKISGVSIKDILKSVLSEGDTLDLNKETGRKSTKDKINNILLQNKTNLSDLLGSLQKISTNDIDDQYTILMKDSIFNKMIDRNNIICITLDLLDSDMYVSYKDNDIIHVINFYHCDDIIKDAKDHINDRMKIDSHIPKNKEPVGLVIVNVYSSTPGVSFILDNSGGKSPNKFSEGIESLMIDLEKAYREED